MIRNIDKINKISKRYFSQKFEIFLNICFNSKKSFSWNKMPSGKFLVTLIGLAATIYFLCTINISKPVVEGFWGGQQFTVSAQPASMNTRTGQVSALPVSVLNTRNGDDATMGSGKFFSVPSFQGILSPRFSNTQYGAYVRYNLPSRDNLAVPCEPLTFSQMAQENFTQPATQNMPRDTRDMRNQPQEAKENFCGGGCMGGSCGSGCPSCGKGGYGLGHDVAGGYELPSAYKNGNWYSEYDSLPGSSSLGSDLPVGSMSTMDGAGNQEQFVTFNRLMYSNRPSSRGYGQGDFIRGDLPITPCNTGWFSVYPNIARDLNPGAMGVLAGAGGGGETTSKLQELLVNATGGVKTTFSGVDLSDISVNSVNMNAQAAMQAGAALSDVSVTSFP